MQNPATIMRAVMEEWSQGFCKPPKTGASAYSGLIQLYAGSPQADCRNTGDPGDPLGLTETPHLLNSQCWCLLITRVSTPTSESFPGEGKHEPPSFLTNTLLFPVEYNIWNHSDLHSSHSLSVCLNFPLCYQSLSLLYGNGSPLPEQSNVIALILWAQELNCRRTLQGEALQKLMCRAESDPSSIPLSTALAQLICAVTLPVRSSGGESSDNSDPPLQSAPNAPTQDKVQMISNHIFSEGRLKGKTLNWSDVFFMLFVSFRSRKLLWNWQFCDARADYLLSLGATYLVYTLR